MIKMTVQKEDQKLNNIYSRMSAIMREVESIAKDRKNEQQGYKFRGIDDIYNAVHPLFRKHGVFITTEILESNREERKTAKGGTLIYSIIRLKINYNAEDGSSIFSTVEGEGMDSGDKATNKALSAALKYSLMQTLLIPTADRKDSEYDSPEIIPQKPKDERLEKIKNLSEYIKQGLRNIGYGVGKAYEICEAEGWDEARIQKRIDKIADTGETK